VSTANARALNREKRARKQSSKSAQRLACDKAFSLWVRSIGVCEAAEWIRTMWAPETEAWRDTIGPRADSPEDPLDENDVLDALLYAPCGPLQCKGGLQCAHILTRGYSVIRHDPRNALSLCQAHHMYWTHRPAEWELFIVAKLGQAHWDELRRLAITPAPTPDYRALLAEIRSWEPRG
jgi:hypothetical protein